MVTQQTDPDVHHNDHVVVVPKGYSSQQLQALQSNYVRLYQESISQPEVFWSTEAKARLDWIKPFTQVKQTQFDGDINIRWFADGVLNVSYNCIDRHLETRGDKVALIWEGDDPTSATSITYRQLHEAVCRFANILKKMGVKKGDRVLIYMPMILEAAYAMLACARIGAVHSVVFGGFSREGIDYQHIGRSIYFRDPDGARLELIPEPLGTMGGSRVV
jgi:acetyl-CoA synthetase